MFERKRILVTGGSGFIGSRLIERLVKEGSEVHVLLRGTSDRTRLNDTLSSITVHEVDLTDEDSLKAVIEEVKPEGVFHLAALNPRYGMVATNKDFFRENTLATMNLVDALDVVDYAFFVHTGSFSEVGPKQVPIREDHHSEPTEAYSISKLGGTLYASMIGKTKKKPIVNIRAFTPYGPYMQKGKIVTQLIEGALAEKEITLSHTGVSRDFIYIDDLIDLYLAVAKVAGQYPGEIFNGGTGIATDLGELVATVERCTNTKIPVVWSNVLASYDHSPWKADVRKVQEKLGWTPQVTLEEGVQKSVVWFKENEDYWRESNK